MTNQEKKKFLSQAYIIERHIETLSNENHKIQAQKYNINLKKEKAVIN